MQRIDSSYTKEATSHMSIYTGMTKLPSVKSTLGQVVPDMRLRYESLDGEHTSAKGSCQKCERNILQRSKYSQYTQKYVSQSCDGDTQRGIDSRGQTNKPRADSQLLLLCKEINDGGARVPTSDQQSKRYVWTIKQNHTHKSKAAERSTPLTLPSRESMWREREAQGKRVTSQ